MKQKIWTEDYRISSFLVNLRSKLGLYSALNLIQDVGWQHALHLDIRLEKNLTWVFTRQKLEMKVWPQWNEILTLKTWVRAPAKNSPFLQRDYELFIAGEKIGQCTSTFGVLNRETRKLEFKDWGHFTHFQSENNLSLTPEKIDLQNEVEDLAIFQVRNSDIDLNQHVNNTKYAQWILDSIPLSELQAGATMLAYEVNFLAETKTGDEVLVQKAVQERPEGEAMWLQFQGQRVRDRKPTFAVRMKVQR